MQITTASFVISNTSVEQCPKDNRPDFAFIGRSNVGKSSLINALCQRKNLAKTSSRPGKTQLINHFLINERWYLVDLPGYGYARVSKKSKKQFQQYITKYFKERKQLCCAFILLDIRHDPQPIDKEFIRWMGEAQIPFVLVFTKADKLSAKKAEAQVSNYLTTLEEEWAALPQHFITSAAKRQGMEALQGFIGSTLDEISTIKTF